MAAIYKITNTVNNKSYIGKTTKSLKERIINHFYSSKYNSECYIHRAIRKYGKANFKIEIIEEVNNINLIDEKEIYWISYYNTLKEGYNMTSGGEGGKILCAKSRNKQKEKRKLQIFSEETKQKIRQSRLGKLASNATKQKLSETHLGEKNGFYGKQHKNESKEKNRVAHSGTNNSCYGKIWINNTIINKLIYPEMFSSLEKDGFVLGRLTSWNNHSPDTNSSVNS